MSVNPYQPPTTQPAPQRADASWDVGEAGPMRFSGQATRLDLDRLIRAHDDVGVSTILLTFMVVAVASTWLWFTNFFAAQMVMMGLSLIAILACIVSTRFYRRSVFVSLNPHWDDPVTGELLSDGVLIQRDASRVFLKWDCVSEVAAGRSVLALMMMPHISESVLIGEQMLTPPVNEQQVNVFLRQIRAHLIHRGTDEERRRYLNVRLRNPDRPRTVNVPADAIPFAGPIFRRDLSGVRSSASRNSAGSPLARMFKMLHRFRPLVVVCVLVLAVACILTGLLHAILPHDPLLAHVLTYGLLVVGWFSYRFSTRRRQTPDTLIQYFIAYADNAGITSDADAIVTHLPWDQMQVAIDTDKELVLKHTQSRRVVVVRRDMFQDASQWIRVKKMAKNVS